MKREVWKFTLTLQMKLKIILFLTAVFLFEGKNLTAQQYIWPTNASRAITSTFSEFRPGHFHSGIDIKTWNREGYKIFAVEDGYISRIKVSPFGYGKVIYQKLSDGNTAVYAHLKGFNEQIEKVVRNEQEKTEEYRVDLHFKSSEYPVKRGDVIGISGKSGTKHPHLHFEIRDSGNNPMNPLLFGFKIKDAIRPTPVKIAFVPLEHGAEVDGGFTEKTYRLHRVGRYTYEIKDTVQIFGKVGLALSAYDMANDIPNKYGINSFRLKIDMVEYFRADYEKFSFSDTRQIEVDREYRLWRKGRGLFHSLYAKPYNTMPFYSYPTKGVLDKSVMPGAHTFEIEVSDYYKNKSTVRGVFVYDQSRPMLYTIVGTSVDKMLLNFKGDGIPLSKVKLSGYIPGKGYIKIGEKKSVSNQNNIAFSISKHSPEFSHIRAKGYNMLGASVPDTYLKLREDEDFDKESSFKYEYYDDHLVIIYEHSEMINDVISLRIKGEESEETILNVNRTGAYEYQASIPLKLLTSAITLSAVSYETGKVLYSEDRNLSRISQKSGGILLSKDGNFMVQFDNKSLYTDYYGEVIIDEKFQPDNGDNEIISPVYRISPSYQPMKEVVKVLLRYPKDAEDREKLGIYYHDSKKGWVFLKNEHDTTMGVLSTNVLSLESFAVLKDSRQPKIERLNIVEGAIMKQSGFTISAKISDNLSGIKDERSILMELDGKKLIFEWHPASNTASYESIVPLEKGKHQLKISARDNANNESVKVRNFIIR